LLASSKGEAPKFAQKLQPKVSIEFYHITNLVLNVVHPLQIISLTTSVT